MRRFPTRSVPMLGQKITGNLMPFPIVGGKEFNSFLETLPLLVNEKSHGVIFYLSHLNIGRQHHDYLRIVQQNLEAEFKGHKGQIFAAQQGDIICVYDAAQAVLNIEETSQKIRTFFSEDVLISEPAPGPGFFKKFNLHTHFVDFTRAALEIINRQNTYLAPKAPDKWIRTATKHASPLTPAKYKDVCDRMAKTDLNRCIRSQPICKFSKDNLQIQSRELYVSVADAQKALDLNVDLLTDPLLFQSLSHFLDRAILHELCKPKSKYGKTDLNLNMSIPSLLSQEFLKLDQSLTQEQKKNITIELQKMDIFADIGAYKYVKAFLHGKGYKICLDGLTHLTLPLIDWKRLGVDGVKLYWSQELEEGGELGKVFKKTDASKIILAHCDHPDAIVWGRATGVKHFQGWHVDKLLMPGYGS